MNRIKLLILNVLAESAADKEVTGMTVNELLEVIEDCCYSTIYKNLRELYLLHYVGIGFPDGKSDTYFISITGKEKREEMMK